MILAISALKIQYVGEKNAFPHTMESDLRIFLLTEGKAHFEPYSPI